MPMQVRGRDTWDAGARQLVIKGRRTRARRFFGPKVALALLPLMVVGSGSDGTSDRGRPPATATGVGRVALDVRTDRRGPALVVVSVLSEGAGPWTIEARARGAKRGRGAVPSTLSMPPGPRLVSGRRSVRVPPGPARNATPPAPRVFHVLARPEADRAASYETVLASPVAWGDFAAIYADEADLADRQVRPGLAEDLVATLERHVLPTCDPWIGRPSDVDGDGRFVVLLTSRIDGLSSAEGPVLGCVRPADFDTSLPGPFSNRCDMLHLDARLAPVPATRTVLAHEYAHATLASRKGASCADGRSCEVEEPWLDEALAHVVEARLGFSDANLAHRVNAFREAPERFRLVGSRQGTDQARCHGQRGAGFLFLSWCVERFGNEVVTRVFDSPERGTKALEDATGHDFASLMEHWAEAMARAGTGHDRARLTPDGPPVRWEAAGTTFHVVPLESVEGVVRVEVVGPEDVELRVSVLAAR